MEIKEKIKELIQTITAESDINKVVWIGAGGSFGGFTPAQYFMQRKSKQIRSDQFTSNEFVYSTPEYIDNHTLAIICSMRGTPETIEAARVAKGKNAITIALYVDKSELTNICDYKIKYQSIALDDSDQEQVNSTIGLMIAINLINEKEGYDDYNDAMEAFDLIDPIYRKAVEYATPLAKKWAKENQDEDTIYVMGSGPSWGSAYIFSICNIEEMLQINSPTINTCEYFHGPFEVTDKNKSFFLLISAGRTRKADERALKFLQRYGGKKVYVLDAKEIGLDRIKDTVNEYFNHTIFSPILNNVYMRQLSYATKKDFNTRRYMWKVDY